MGQSLAVTSHTVPSQPAAISGNTNVCNGTSETYSITAVTGAVDYTWIYGGTGAPVGTGTECTLEPTSSGILSVHANNACGSGNNSTLNITVENCPTPCGGPYEEVTNPTTGKIWLDRNLGATRVATAYNDAQAYGYWFQWGRACDGHESRSSTQTTTLSSTDQPGHNKFITTTATPLDWRVPQNDNLWQGLGGVNNPCPTGFRIPTWSEINAEKLSWSQNNMYGAFASPLKFTTGGYRHNNGGSQEVGAYGHYWSSTIYSNTPMLSYSLYFSYGYASSTTTTYRAQGYSVRCIKD